VPYEELFWVHELDGKFDFTSADAESALAALRKDAVQNTAKGAVAQHNLAVILTCMAQGLNGSRRLDYWKDAIQHWAATLANDVFWQFMLDRAEGLNGNGEMSAAHGLRTVAREVLSEYVEQVYLPYVQQAKRPSTYRGYKIYVATVERLVPRTTPARHHNR